MEEDLLPLETTKESWSSRRSLRWVFKGSDGIRAGWSLMLFIAALIGACYPMVKIADYFHVAGPGKDSTPDTAIASQSLLLSVVAAATIAMALIERRSPLSYGFTDRKWLVRVVSGFCVCLLAHSVQIGLMMAGGWISFSGATFGGVGLLKVGALGIVGCLAIGLSEEAFFRGYPLQTLARGLRFWWAAIILSVLFGVVHMSDPTYTWIDAAQIVSAGLLFSLSYRVTGSLYFAIGFHTAWDWIETFVYGVADGTKPSAVHLVWFQPGHKWKQSGTIADSALSLLVVSVLFGFWLWRHRVSRATLGGTPHGTRVTIPEQDSIP